MGSFNGNVNTVTINPNLNQFLLRVISELVWYQVDVQSVDFSRIHLPAIELVVVGNEKVMEWHAKRVHVPGVLQTQSRFAELDALFLRFRQAFAYTILRNAIEDDFKDVLPNDYVQLYEALRPLVNKLTFRYQQLSSLERMSKNGSHDASERILCLTNVRSVAALAQNQQLIALPCYRGGEISAIDQGELIACFQEPDRYQKDPLPITELHLLFSSLKLFESHFEVQYFLFELKSLLKKMGGLRKLTGIHFSFIVPTVRDGMKEQISKMLQPIFFDAQFSELRPLFSQHSSSVSSGVITKEYLFRSTQHNRMLVFFETDMEKAAHLQLHCSTYRCHVMRVYQHGQFHGTFPDCVARWLSVKDMPVASALQSKAVDDEDDVEAGQPGVVPDDDFVFIEKVGARKVPRYPVSQQGALPSAPAVKTIKGPMEPVIKEDAEDDDGFLVVSSVGQKPPQFM